MLREVLCNFQFTEGDLIYVENHPALVISVCLSGINVLMLRNSKIETRNIERERIGNAWNNVHIDYCETVSLTPDMEKLIEFLTGASYLGR